MAYLQKRNKIWHVRVPIPQDLLRQFAPKTEIKLSLKTASLAQARQLSCPVIHDIQQTFFRARYSDAMPNKIYSKRAIEIWLLQNPGKAWIPPSPYGGHLSASMDNIQRFLDHGYDLDESGKFDTTKPPQNDPVQYQRETTPSAPALTKPIIIAKSMKTAASEYLVTQQHVTTGTLNNKRNALRHLGIYAGGAPVSEVMAYAGIDKFVNDHLTNVEKMAHSTKTTVMVTVKHFATHCMRKGLIEREAETDIRNINIVQTATDKYMQNAEKANEMYTDTEINRLLTDFILDAHQN